MRKATWLVIRGGIVLLILASMLTMSLSAFALAPVYTRVFFADWRFWKYLDRFWPLTRHLWKVAGKLIFEPQYRQMTSFMSLEDWLRQPSSGPDESEVKVSDDWPYPEDSCGECNRCCTYIDCPAHEKETGLCSMYSSAFWHYFPCGRYPATQPQIDYYECPKWELITTDKGGSD